MLDVHSTWQKQTSDELRVRQACLHNRVTRWSVMTCGLRWPCACRMWQCCVLGAPPAVVHLGFTWFTHVAMMWPLPPQHTLSLLDDKMVHLSPNLCEAGWACFLAFFRQVGPRPAPAGSAW